MEETTLQLQQQRRQTVISDSSLLLEVSRNLSSLPKNGLQMIREHAERPLLDLLFSRNMSHSSLQELIATTIMNLATSIVSQDSDQLPVSFLESDEDISTLFSLVGFTGPNVQIDIIRPTFCVNPTHPQILKPN
ncbi:hypothetical protein CsatB_024054 [Cannabis sativa]